MNGSPRLSFSISTTPSMSCTGISSSRSSTPITTSAASCRSMSTTPSARVPSRSCCAPARPRRVSRCAPICAGSCAISANAGPGRASPSRRRPLCQPRGDGMVRGQPHRLRLPGSSKPLSKKIDEAADAVRTERALSNKPVVRGYAETRHKANPGPRAARRRPHRSHSAQATASARSSPTSNTARYEWVYNAFYCARGQAENLIKLHKTQLASDRTLRSFRDRKSGPPRAAHGGTKPCSPFAALHPETARCRRRVHDAAVAADQGRRPRRRNRQPRPSRFRRQLPEADLFRGLPGALAPLGP